MDNSGGGKLVAIKSLSERIPDETFEKIHLVELRWSNSLINLSSRICELTNLTSLDLGHNKLCELPDSITRLTNLQMLNLSNNKLKVLPRGCYALSRAKLDISENDFESFPINLMLGVYDYKFNDRMIELYFQNFLTNMMPSRSTLDMVHQNIHRIVYERGLLFFSLPNDVKGMIMFYLDPWLIPCIKK